MAALRSRGFAAGVVTGLVAGVPLALAVAHLVRRHRSSKAPRQRNRKGLRRQQQKQLEKQLQNGDAPAAERTVVVSDTLEWLEAQESFPAGTCVITGIPDITEAAPAAGAGTHMMALDEYMQWAQKTVAMILQRLPPGGCAIFVQTDIKVGAGAAGTYHEWVDKSFILQCAAKTVDDVRLLWHKITAFDELGTMGSLRRARYSHVLCFGKGSEPERHDGPMASVPDVGRRGCVTWARGTGVRCCLALCRYAKKRGSTLVVDPFCGEGAVLALAGYCGLDSIGVELNRKRAESAKCLDGAVLVAKDKADIEEETVRGSSN